MDEHPTLGLYTHAIDARKDTSHYFLFNLMHVKRSCAENDQGDGNPVNEILPLACAMGEKNLAKRWKLLLLSIRYHESSISNLVINLSIILLPQTAPAFQFLHNKLAFRPS